jgi:hypothetical protein
MSRRQKIGEWGQRLEQRGKKIDQFGKGMQRMVTDMAPI